MKKSFYLLLSLLLSIVFYSCSDDKDDNLYQTIPLEVEVVYPDGVSPREGVVVKLRNTVNDTSFEEKTQADGVASFKVPSGVYEASASEARWDEQEGTLYNALNSQVAVAGTLVKVQLKMTASKASSLVIKEIYAGGCPKDDGSGAFIMDQSVVLYNNSQKPVDLSELAFGIVAPYNSQASNNYYKDGKLIYASEGWIPAISGFWYFTSQVTLEPGKQLVVAITGAIDNTKTYSQSINYANKDYYCFYDVEDFNNPKYYPTPSEKIPVSHYLKAYKFTQGNAWVFSTTSPGAFIFRPKGTTLEQFYQDAGTTDSNGNKKIPVDWIVDGVEAFAKGWKNNQKRFTEKIDAGYVEMTTKQAYTLYRNVDKSATESFPGNEGKLVYDYAGGVEGTTDPSGIDAEASLKKGAHIIYQDTNNSSKDFHQRGKSSLRQ